jgi:hypothetical protein
VVKPLAEIRDLERPSGPPSGGSPTGIHFTSSMVEGVEITRCALFSILT